ncbi:MAG: DUF4145 domain-containing protein [Patescibacteria group bacterium]
MKTRVAYENAPTQKLFRPNVNADCPHCNKPVGITLISKPNYQDVARHKLEKVGMVYKCEGCSKPIYFEYSGCTPRGNELMILGEHQITQAKPFIDLSNINSKDVQNDVEEALSCYSVEAWNGFAAVCRRTLQSICKDKDVKGKSKVEKQVKLFISTYSVDKDLEEILLEVTQLGHDGAHPFLPPVNKDRAEKLLVFLKEIVRQVYDLPAILGESKKLRDEAKPK